MPKTRKRIRVMLRNMMMRVDAVLVRAVIPDSILLSIVGIGRGVGVVGGGTMQELLSAFITIPIWQRQSSTSCRSESSNK